MSDLFFNLQLFSEESAEVPMGGTESFAEDNAVASDDAGQYAADDRRSFDDLIKTDYKEDYNRHVNEIIRKRFKNQKDNQDILDMINPGLEMLATKYGIDPKADDFHKQLNDKIVGDDSYYQDEAFERGMDVDTLKTLKATERENARLNNILSQQQVDYENKVKFDRINAQAEQVKQFYPNFDIDVEMQNPEFDRLVWSAGVPVQTAYEVIHRDEVFAGAMQYSANRTKEAMSDAIQSGLQRPREGAMMGRSGSFETMKSPKDWTMEERAEIRKRVKSGEKVVF